MNNPDTITIKTNFWCVPSRETAFDGWLEGEPTEEERLEVIAKTIAARASWKPSAEAFALLVQLRIFFGSRVKIQMWDNDMWMFPEEGPNPFTADYKGVIVLDIDGFQQAFIEVSNVVVLPTPGGYDPMPYLQTHTGSKFALVPLSDLYEVSRV